MKQEWKEAYASMPASVQARVLAMLAHDLTFWNRSGYVAVTKNDQQTADVLTASNELQHRITEQLHHLLVYQERLYSDEDFWEMCFASARQAGCEDKLVEFLEQTQAALLRSKEGTCAQAAHAK